MKVPLSSVSICSLLFIMLTAELGNSILTSSRLEGNERNVMGTDMFDQNCIAAGRDRQDCCEMPESGNRCQRRITGATRTLGLAPVTAAGQTADMLLSESVETFRLHKHRGRENTATSSLL